MAGQQSGLAQAAQDHDEARGAAKGDLQIGQGPAASRRFAQLGKHLQA